MTCICLYRKRTKGYVVIFAWSTIGVSSCHQVASEKSLHYIFSEFSWFTSIPYLWRWSNLTCPYSLNRYIVDMGTWKNQHWKSEHLPKATCLRFHLVFTSLMAYAGTSFDLQCLFRILMLLTKRTGNAVDDFWRRLRLKHGRGPWTLDFG